MKDFDEETLNRLHSTADVSASIIGYHNQNIKFGDITDGAQSALVEIARDYLVLYKELINELE